MRTLLKHFFPAHNGVWHGGFLTWLMLFALGSANLQAAEALAPAPGATEVEVQRATRAYLDRLSPEQKARSDAYFEGGYWLALWNYLLGAAIALLLLETRLSCRMRDWAARWTRRRFVHTAGYWLLYLVLTSILAFPLTVYELFVREHQYGLATQGLASWFVEQLIGLGVTAVLGGILVAALFAVVRRLSGSWHLWGSAVIVLFLAVSVAIAPVFIAPLFNQYTRLENPKVVEPILRLARANGVGASDVWQMDASRQTTRISANVSGLFGTERITLNDNLLQRCSLPEIEAVMAHELGHYVLNHIPKMLLFLGVLIVIGMSLLRWALHAALARWGSRWGIQGVADPAVLPLAVLLLSTYLFVLTPLTNTYIRTQELEADIFGLNAARQPDGFAEAAMKLADYRKLEPSPLEEWIFYHHPSGRTRVATAMRWKLSNAATEPFQPLEQVGMSGER